MKFALSFWVSVLYVSTLHAAERFELFNGVRSLGMGGVQVAVVNDETALIGNPAALGRLRDAFFTLVDPEIELGTETQAIFESAVMAFNDPQDIVDLLEQPTKADKRYRQRLQVFPSVVFPNFGLGVFGKWDTSAYRSGTDVVLYHTTDYAGVAGFNFRIWDGRIKLGFNARYMNHVLVNEVLPVASTGLTKENLAREGVGLATDVGLILQAPWAWLPTLAAVYRDVGTTTYTLSDGMFYDTAERPPSTPATLDVGLALFPIAGKSTRTTFSVEMKDVLNAFDTETSKTEEEDPSRRYHVGLEVNIGDALFIRGGMNQRYWTAGLEFAVMNYQLQFATYGEEVGDENDYEEDRRYVAKFSWRF